jgi:hypothetical protein
MNEPDWADNLQAEDGVRAAIISSSGYTEEQKKVLLRVIDALEAANTAHRPLADVLYFPDREGEAVAAVVPMDVATAGLAAVVALEDRADVRDAREELARIAAGEPTIPWEQVKAELAELDR